MSAARDRYQVRSIRVAGKPEWAIRDTHRECETGDMPRTRHQAELIAKRLNAEHRKSEVSP